MQCGQVARDSGSLLRRRNTGRYGAANDSLLPAWGSLIKVMQNSLLMTLIVEFGHEMKNICGVNNKIRQFLFLAPELLLEELRVHHHAVWREDLTPWPHTWEPPTAHRSPDPLFPSTEHPTWGLYFHKGISRENCR